MRLLVYQSKLFAVLFCTFAAGMVAAFFLLPAAAAFPPFIKWLVATMAFLMFVFTIKGFVAGSPIISADESGLIDKRIFWEAIPWERILAFRHVPKSYQLANGKKAISPFDAWRPIQLWIDAPDHKIFKIMNKLKRVPQHPDFPGSLYLEIDFSGLDTSSKRLVELIREYSPTAKEIKS